MSELTIGEDDYGTFWKDDKGRVIRRERGGLRFRCAGAKTDDYITAMVANGIKLRLNTMSDRVEVRGEPVTDIGESVIINRLFDCDLHGEAKMRRAMHEAANRNKYHPVRVYLDSLVWDGKDHFAALMGKLETSSPMADVFFKKWLIGAIAKVLNGEQNFMLVLVAAQGIGKSRLARWFAPLQRLFYEGAIRPDDKDSLLRLLNNWIWEVAELDATTRKSDRSSLKHIVSAKMVKIRVPYGRYDIEKPAAASFIGTVNPDGTGFLNDPSGNRRFAIVELDGIDWSYTDIDIAQLWAQVYAMYKAGEAWELTPDEQTAQNETNERHTTRAFIEDVLDANFVFDPEDTKSFFTTNDLVSLLEGMGLKQAQFRIKGDLYTAMAKRGIERSRRRVDGKRQYGYAGVRQDISDSAIANAINL